MWNYQLLQAFGYFFYFGPHDHCLKFSLDELRLSHLLQYGILSIFWRFWVKTCTLTTLHLLKNHQKKTLLHRKLLKYFPNRCCACLKATRLIVDALTISVEKEINNYFDKNYEKFMIFSLISFDSKRKESSDWRTSRFLFQLFDAL